MLTILLALAVQTATPAPVATPAPTAAPAPEKKQCRRLETTGSIMAKQTCHTPSEWAAIDGAHKVQMDQYRDRRLRGSATATDR